MPPNSCAASAHFKLAQPLIEKAVIAFSRKYRITDTEELLSYAIASYWNGYCRFRQGEVFETAAYRWAWHGMLRFQFPRRARVPLSFATTELLDRNPSRSLLIQDWLDELIEELDEYGRECVRLALDPPVPVKRARDLRTHIRRHLESQGWTGRQVKQAFRAVRSALI